MAALTLRSVKGTPLTNSELDANFTSLNTELGQKLVASSNLSDLTNAATARTNLGLGSLATQSSLKTVNGQSVLGSGNIQIDGGVTSFNTRTGAVSLTSGDVTTALGYTPLSNATSYLPLSGGTLTGASTVAVSTWEKWTLETTGVTARARQGSDGNGLNFTSNARWTGSAWAEDDSTRKKFAYIQHLGNGRHEFRVSPTGAGVSWTTSLTIDENAVNSSVALQQGGNQVVHAGNVSTYALPIGGGTVTGAITIGGGGDLNLQAASGSNDSGDLVWRNGAGSEVHRLWDGGTGLNYRNNAGTGYLLVHAGNVGSYALPIGGGTLSGSLYAPNLYSTGIIEAQGQVRASGWWGSTSGGYSLMATEMGVSGGQGYILTYNRVTSAYGTLNIEGSGSSLRVGSAVNVTSGALQQGGNQVLHAGNFSSYAYPQANTPGGYVTPAGGLNGAVNGWSALDGYGTPVPNYGGSDWWVGVWTGGNSSRGIQIAGGYSDSELYFRKGAGGWSSWRRVLNDSNYSSYALPLSGGTLTGNLLVPKVVINANNDLSWGGNYSDGKSTIAATGSAMYFYPSGNISGSVLALSSGTVNATAALQQNGNQVLHAGNYSGYVLGWRGQIPTNGWDAAGHGHWVSYGQTGETGGPSSLYSYGGLLSFRASDFGGNHRLQIYASHTGDMAFRTGWNDWSYGWRTLLHSANFTSYSPSLTGSGASGTWGINITGTARGLDSANYIARTGSSGNLNTDFQNTPAGTMRYQGDDANLSNSPGNAWWVYQHFRHSNSSNFWGLQVAWGWEDNANRLATRNVTGNSFGSWVYYLNSSNYTSYSPGYTGSSGALRVQTGSGYVDIGPMNSSWSHFQTDRGQFYFGSPIYVDGNIGHYGSGNNDKRYTKDSSHLNLRDPWGNLHMKQGDGGGVYIDAAHHYIRSSSGSAWVYIDGGSFTYNGNAVLHAGNYSSYAVPRSEHRNFGAIYINPAGYNTTCTTAQFVSHLSSLGMFNYPHATAKVAWDYAGNNDITDTGFGQLELAGCVIETWVNGDSTRHIRVTRPTTGAGGFQTLIYNDQGSGYSPGWRQYITSENIGSQSVSTASTLSLGGHTISNNSWAGGGGYHGYTFSGGNWRFGFSSTGGVVDVYADGNFYATDSSHLVLHAGNYTNYSPSYSGGTLTGGWYFLSNLGGYAGSLSSPALQAYCTGGNSAFMSFHRGGSYAINMGLDADNVFRIGGWSASSNRLQMDMSGNLTMAGNVTAYSDERLKKDWALLPLDFVQRLAQIKSGTYTRIDSEERQAGASAQDWQALLPEVVSQDNEGYLALAYGNAAVVSVIELAKDNMNLRARIERLESLINKLIGD